MVADTRTNAGLDNISTFRKLHVFEEPGHSVFALASAGNLSLSQSVVSLLQEGIENRETGDLSRWLTAELIGGPDVKNAKLSHYYIAMNRGKRSITLDLKKSAAIEVVRRLTNTHDVLLTNYRPGVLDRLGSAHHRPFSRA